MAVGSKLFFDMMHSQPPKVMLFGGACSQVTAPLAESSIWWNIWQVSYTVYVFFRSIRKFMTIRYRANYKNKRSVGRNRSKSQYDETITARVEDRISHYAIAQVFNWYLLFEPQSTASL